jgi:hypothetical protein
VAWLHCSPAGKWSGLPAGRLPTRKKIYNFFLSIISMSLTDEKLKGYVYFKIDIKSKKQEVSGSVLLRPCHFAASFIKR